MIRRGIDLVSSLSSTTLGYIHSRATVGTKFAGGLDTDNAARGRSGLSCRPHFEQLEARTLLSASSAFPYPSTATPPWIPVGPAPITQVSGVLPNYTPSSEDVGAVNALAVDPRNPAHVYAATVNGGIWETKNYTAAQPIWTTTTDHMPSLAISAIAISPVNNKVIYAGTGNYSSAGGGGVFGPGMGDNAAGIYKSSDGGATWKVINPKGIFDGLRIRRIVPTTLNRGQTIFAATTDTAVRNGAVNRGGVYCSDDGGKSWTRVSGTRNLPSAGVTDIAANPANPKEIFVAIAGQAGGSSPDDEPNPVPSGASGIYRLDLSARKPTWENITGNAIADTIKDAVRVELSISEAGDNPIWVTTIRGVDINSSSDVFTPAFFYSGTFRAADAKTPVWTSVGAPDVLQGFEGETKGCMLADPHNANLLYVAGDIVNYFPYTTYVARFDYSNNTWTNITANSPTFAEVTQVQRTGGVATLTATHSFAVGQLVGVSGLADTTFNGTFTVTAATDTTFSFALSGPDIAATPDSGTATLWDSPSLANVSRLERNDDNVATLTINQTFRVGEQVIVSGLTDPSFNGTFTITAVTATTMSYESAGPHVAPKSENGLVTLVAFGPGTVEPIQTGVTSGPHADTRFLQFGAGGQLLLACDGGVYLCNAPERSGSQVVWSSINGSLGITEFYQVALDNRGNTNPDDDLILGGGQDVGASERGPNGTWIEHAGADGVEVAADPTSGTRYFSEDGYYLHTVTGTDPEQSPPGRLTGTGGDYLYLNPAASVPNNAVLADSFPFNVVFVLNQADITSGLNPARLLLGGNQTLYLSDDRAETFTSIGGIVGTVPQPVANISATIMAMAFGSAPNPNVAYVCTSDGYISVTQDISATNGGFANHVLLPNGEVGLDVVIDENDPMTAYAVTPANVFVTNDGGSSWTSIKDNLGQLLKPFVLEPSLYNEPFPVGRSVALFNNGTVTKADDFVLVGEPGGVFRRMVEPPASLCANTWQAFGAGTTLPNTLVTSLVYNSKSDALLAGSLGRGAWLLKNASALLNTGLYNGSLILTATTGSDNIQIVAAGKDRHAVGVIMNGTNLGVFRNISGQIIINGLTSQDHVDVAKRVRLHVVLNSEEHSTGHRTTHDQLFDSIANDGLLKANLFDDLSTAVERLYRKA